MPRRQASNTVGNAPITRPPPQRVGRDWHIPREHPLTALLQSTCAGLEFHLEDGQTDMLVVPTHLMLGVLLALGVPRPGSAPSIRQSASDAGGWRGFTLTDDKMVELADLAADLIGTFEGDDTLTLDHRSWLRCMRPLAQTIADDPRSELQASHFTLLQPLAQPPPAPRPRSAAGGPRGRTGGRRHRSSGDAEEETAEGEDEALSEARAAPRAEVEDPGRFIEGIPLTDFALPHSPLPLEGLGHFRLLLGPGGPPATVRCELWRVAAMRAALGPTGVMATRPSDPLLGSVFPGVFRQTLLDESYRSGQLDDATLRDELVDGITLASGTPAERQSIELRRLPNMLDDQHAVLRQLLRGLGPHEAHERVERLSALYLRGREQQPIRLRLRDIEAQLAARRGLIERHISEHEHDGAGGEQVMALLNAEHAATAEIGRGALGGMASGSVVHDGMAPAAPPSRTVRREALIRAHDEAAFLGFCSRWEGQDVTANGPAVWDDANTCGSAALISFGATMDRETTFDGSHPIYGQLRLIQGDRRQGYAEAQMREDSGAVPVPEMRAWTWSEAAFKLWLARRFDEIDFVNGDSGVLGLLNLKEVNGFAAVPKAQIWAVPAVLDYARPFIHRTFTHQGFAHVSSNGYTIATLIDLHKENLLWCRDLGGALVAAQTEFMVQSFLRELKRIGLRTLAKDRAVDPTSVKYDTVAAFGCDYERETKLRKETIEPVRTLRRAMPELLPAPAPKVIEGVRGTPPSDRGAGGAGRGAGSSAGGDGGGGARAAKGRGGDPRPTQPGGVQGRAGQGAAPPAVVDPPGSRASLAFWLGNGRGQGDLMLGGDVYDIDKIAAKYSLGRADKDWPVLLSSKPGAAKLTLCPCPQHSAHRGGLSAPAHTAPPGWDPDFNNKNFKREATAAERARRPDPAPKSHAKGAAAAPRARKRRLSA